MKTALTQPWTLLARIAAPKRNALVIARREADRANALAAKHGRPDSSGHTEVPLSVLSPGDIGHVLSLTGTPSIKQHLLELGFTLGTEVQFVRCAPLSDPITVKVRGYQLALRRKEAEAILVRRCPRELELD